MTSLFRFAELKNSLISLVFPLPASPETKTVFPFPSKAELRNDSNSSSSRSLPTRTGSDRTPVFKLDTAGLVLPRRNVLVLLQPHNYGGES